MASNAAFAEVASLAGDPGRAGMLHALMDGRALTATELAGVAGITPQTASGHLAQLTAGGLVTVQQQGRHRYHRLASPAVARMLESIMSVAAGSGGPDGTGRRAPIVVGPRDKALRRARTCYDHLAGQIAVAMTDRMLERGQVDFSADGGMLTERGVGFLRDIGVDIDALAERTARRGGRIFCCPCLDWSERRSHIAGAVGAALCQACFTQGWLRRIDGTRAVSVTPAGQMALRRAFDLRPEI